MDDKTFEVLNILSELKEKVDHMSDSIDKKVEGAGGHSLVTVNKGALATCAMLLRVQNNLLNSLMEKILTEKDELQTMMDAFNEKKKE